MADRCITARRDMTCRSLRCPHSGRGYPGCRERLACGVSVVDASKLALRCPCSRARPWQWMSWQRLSGLCLERGSAMRLGSANLFGGFGDCQAWLVRPGKKTGA